ncbi:hypothetical protein [Haloarcula litorea]|nr:hypothetical protein [Halomicroarcula sp. GDY20]
MLSLGQKLIAMVTLLVLVAVVAVLSPIYGVVVLLVAAPLAVAILRR